MSRHAVGSVEVVEALVAYVKMVLRRVVDVERYHVELAARPVRVKACAIAHSKEVSMHKPASTVRIQSGAVRDQPFAMPVNHGLQKLDHDHLRNPGIVQCCCCGEAKP